MTLRDAVAALRPKQWIKNAFVLVGTLFGHRWASDDLLQAGLAFAAFCLASSAVYLYNDWIDRDADRRHLTKRFRPIAAGRLHGAQVVLLAALAAAGAYAL
ncbi:MAG: UbiA family prenyltransferase, partial [Acidobacteriota bacterium]